MREGNTNSRATAKQSPPLLTSLRRQQADGYGRRLESLTLSSPRAPLRQAINQGMRVQVDSARRTSALSRKYERRRRIRAFGGVRNLASRTYLNSWRDIAPSKTGATASMRRFQSRAMRLVSVIPDPCDAPRKPPFVQVKLRR